MRRRASAHPHARDALDARAHFRFERRARDVDIRVSSASARGTCAGAARHEPRVTGQRQTRNKRRGRSHAPRRHAHALTRGAGAAEQCSTVQRVPPIIPLVVKEAVNDLKTMKCLLTPRQRLEMACSLRSGKKFRIVERNSGRCTMRFLGRNYTL